MTGMPLLAASPTITSSSPALNICFRGSVSGVPARSVAFTLIQSTHTVREVGADDPPQSFDRGHAAEKVAEVRIGKEQLRRRLRPDVIAGGEQIRPGNVTALHQFAQPDIDVARHPRATGGGHARLQRRAHLRQAADVHVRVDEARAPPSGCADR